tara:strand:- start:192 stop:551 length:360 start_codon:yes stop_codon:yes gene_type:complete
MKEFIYAIPSILLIGFANAILKWRIVYLNSKNIEIFSSNFLKFLFDPYISIGALAALLSVIWWLNIVSYVRIGIVYPMIQAGAIMTTLLLSIFLIKEPINIFQIFAILLIVAGIVLLTK